MKLIYGLLLSSIIFSGNMALAENVRCRMKISGLNTIVEASDPEKYKAHAKAVEQCVEARVKKYLDDKGVSVNEEEYSLFIDKCTVTPCDNS